VLNPEKVELKDSKTFELSDTLMQLKHLTEIYLKSSQHFYA